MIIVQLRKIKNYYPWIWKFLERINGSLLRILSARIIENINIRIEGFTLSNGYLFKRLRLKDADGIAKMLSRADLEDVKYFKPFEFNNESIMHAITCGSYICFQAVSNDLPAGFFFLRVSYNRKAFLGFYVDKLHRGVGLGKSMITALVNACVENGFELYSSVSEHNQASMKAHEGNGFYRINRMQNDYWLLGIEKNSRRDRVT